MGEFLSAERINIMKLVKNFLLNGLYQLLLVILPLVTAPYVSRVLGAHGVGIYAFTGANVQYFVLLAILGTSTYGNREIAYHQNDKQKRSDIFWGINFLSWITAAISLFAFGIFIIVSRKYQDIYAWQSLLILTSLFDISWYFMGRENFKVTVTRNFIFKILTVISIFVFVKNSNDLPIYIAIMCIGGLLGSISLWPYLKHEVFKPKLKNLNLKKHLHYTIILFIPTIAVQIYWVANKSMIGLMDSVVHAGFFQQSDSMIKMALSIIGTIGVVMLPRVASMHSEGNINGIRNSIVKTFNIATGISFGIFFGILGISLKFAPFFWGKSFEMVGLIMMIEAPIIIFIPMSNVFGTQYLLPLNRMKPYTFSVTFGAILNIVVNLAFIPLFGVIGATVATVVSEFAVTVYQYLSIRKEFSFSDLFGGLWKYFISGLLMFVVVFWMNQSFKMTIIQLILQIILGVLIYTLSNILLKTQLWLMASELLGKMKNRVSRNHIRIDQKQEILEHPLDTIKASFDQFAILFQEIDGKKTLSHKNFLTNLNNFDNTLKNVTFNDDLDKNDIIRLSDFIAELSIIMSRKRDYLKVQDQEHLYQFAQGLNILASKMEKIAQEEYSPKELKEWFRKELGE